MTTTYRTAITKSKLCPFFSWLFIEMLQNKMIRQGVLTKYMPFGSLGFDTFTKKILEFFGKILLTFQILIHTLIYLPISLYNLYLL